MRALSILLLLVLLPLGAAESNDDIMQRFSLVEHEDALQPGCTFLSRDMNPCHQIATDMNGLDSPIIDVLILVPASPAAERDMRILRQSTEMWADGIQWMASDLGLDWLAEGVEFHIFMEMINTGESEFTTYPIVDPEIVVIASNPVGGIGIGIDPIDFAGILFGEGAGQGPCHGVANPFDHSVWQNLPGFDDHHGGRSGTYREDCGGAGGNICFSVNAAIDPFPDGAGPSPVDFNLYDLVSHETGHCLTLGHVGDGAEGSWSSVPTNDIMAYHNDPPGKFKCVSSLNVEAFATVMSRYLDVDGDGLITADDEIFANDAEGDFDDRPFQIQHPDNHYYASPTRQAIDCPQPDVGLNPLQETVDFIPEAPARSSIALHLQPGQGIAHGTTIIGGNMTGDGQVMVRAVAQEDFLADPMRGEGVHNVSAEATVVDGNWTAELDLSSFADGSSLIIEAVWMQAGERIDSDRAFVLVDSTLPLEAPSDVLGSDREASGLAVVGLLAAIAVALVRRRV